MVARARLLGEGAGNETALAVVAVIWGEGGGAADEEGGAGNMATAVAAGGAADPHEITAGVHREKEALRRSARKNID